MNRVKQTVIARGIEVGGSDPVICAPLVGRSIDELVTECKQIIAKKPDIIEWRADFFEAISDTNQVAKAVRAIRDEIGNVPLLFTIRSVHEGGQPISLTDGEVVDRIASVCQTKLIDFVDYELRNDEQSVRTVSELAKQNDIHLILSYHNFQETPNVTSIVKKLERMEQGGAHIAKVAVMPNNKRDVLTLLQATQMAREELTIPLIAISMGEEGAISRIAGWMFGSAVTFAIANESSAPGQIPIDQLRSTIEQIKLATK